MGSSPDLSCVVGIDASLTNTAVVAVNLDDLRRKSSTLSGCVRTLKVETPASEFLGRRLSAIYSSVSDFFSLVGRSRCLIAMEGFSFADRYRQYDLGAVQGVIRLAAHNSLGLGISSVPPRNAKMFICPDWYGFSNENWDACFGPPKPGQKRRRSMPNKDDVSQALYKRFRFNPNDEHVVDATLVALAFAKLLGVLPLEYHCPSSRPGLPNAQKGSSARPRVAAPKEQKAQGKALQEKGGKVRRVLGA